MLTLPLRVRAGSITSSAIPAAIAGVAVNSAEIVKRKPASFSGPVVFEVLFFGKPFVKLVSMTRIVPTGGGTLPRPVRNAASSPGEGLRPS
jgi:hypothetical protein